MNSSEVEHLLYTEAVGGSIPSSPTTLKEVKCKKMLSIRCKVCNKELVSSNKIQCCGCPNMTTIKGETVTAKDLSKVLLLNPNNNIKKQPLLSNDDLKYQEERRKRRVRRINYEER